MEAVATHSQGTSPESISPSTTPKEYTSAAALQTPFCRISGAIHCAVPIGAPVPPPPPTLATPDSPKSQILIESPGPPARKHPCSSKLSEMEPTAEAGLQWIAALFKRNNRGRLHESAKDQ